MCRPTAAPVSPRSFPRRSCETKVLPMRSVYAQSAVRVRSTVGVILGSRVARIGTMQNWRRSLGLAIAGFTMRGHPGI